MYASTRVESVREIKLGVTIMIEPLGYVGGSILGIQLLPQIYKVVKNRKADDISKSFLILNLIGLSLMSIYGVLDENPPIYIPTIVSCINTSILYVAVCFVGKEKTNEAIDLVSSL